MNKMEGQKENNIIEEEIMNARVSISKVEFSDGTEVEFNSNQIIVIVGPNNSGKSVTLKEIFAQTNVNNHKTKVVTSVKLEKQGDVKDVIELIKKTSIDEQSIGEHQTYKGYNFQIHGGLLSGFWAKKNETGELHNIFFNLLTTEARLGIASPATNIALNKDPLQHPIHFIQKDDKLEYQFSEYFKIAFNEELIVHRNAGNKVPLHIGKRPIPKEGDDRISRSYLDELDKLPLLHEQGDGMRSFVGVLLSAFISDYTVLLIDEPEAFLHPPQARLLGKMLAKDLPTDRQLFLATHSSDFLKGLLDADVTNLKILRIIRDKDINKVSVLDNSDIRQLWGDPLLRYSNILDGLFHSKVIICESDSDCRFYSAIFQSLYENESNISPDYLFIHCGGKQRVNSVVKALKKLNVQIFTILDFDVLNDINPLKDIFESLGGDWDSIKNDWKQLKKSIDEKKPELATDEFKVKINKILENTPEKIFPKEKLNEIKTLLTEASVWSFAKKMGKSFIPSGNATQSYGRLIMELKKVGLLVVEVGELECFIKSVGNHGPKWVNEVLQKDITTDPEFNEAKDFIRNLI